MSTYSSLRESLLATRSVALVGASRDTRKLSGMALDNLRRSGFGGRVVVVNPAMEATEGIEVVPDVPSIATPVDLALSLVPAARTEQVVAELGALGTGVVIVASSDFAESGSDGDRRQRHLVETARQAGTRLIGPNCNGLYTTALGMSLGYNRAHSRRLPPGDISLVSQSGALIGPIVHNCESGGGRLRFFVSTGNEADLGALDMLEMLLDDDATRVVMLVIDRVDDGRRFDRLCARAAAVGKRLLVLKFGNSAAGQAASASHSASMAGDARIYDAVLSRHGITRCASIPELAATACLASRVTQPLREPLVLTTSGAGGAIMADALADAGVPLAVLEQEATRALRAGLRFVEPSNPVDLGAGGSANLHGNLQALTATARDRLSVLLYTPPPDAIAAARYAEALPAFAAAPGVTTLAVVQCDEDQQTVRQWSEAGIPVLHSAADAAAVIANLYRAPSTGTAQGTGHDGSARGDHDHGEQGEPARSAAHLGEQLASRLLARHGLAFPQQFLAADVEQALDAARRIGTTTVLKGLHSGTSHKAREGLVRLDLTTPQQVGAAFEQIRDRLARLDGGENSEIIVAEQVDPGLDLLLALRRDREFGWIHVLGLGGILTERLAQVSLMLDADRADVLAGLSDCGALEELRLLGIPPGEAVDSVYEAFRALRAAADDPSLAADTIEVNPLRLIPPNGRAIALDALIVAMEEEAE